MKLERAWETIPEYGWFPFGLLTVTKSPRQIEPPRRSGTRDGVGTGTATTSGNEEGWVAEAADGPRQARVAERRETRAEARFKAAKAWWRSDKSEDIERDEVQDWSESRMYRKSDGNCDPWNDRLNSDLQNVNTSPNSDFVKCYSSYIWRLVS